MPIVHHIFPLIRKKSAASPTKLHQPAGAVPTEHPSAIASTAPPSASTDRTSPH